MNRYELSYDFMKTLIAEQGVNRQSIEVKARTALTLSVALLGVAVLIATNLAGGLRGIDLPTAAVAALVVGAFLSTFWFSFQALLARDWRVSPQPRILQSHASNQSNADEEILEWLTDGMIGAYYANVENLGDKSAKLEWAFRSLLAEVALIVVLIAV